ncbi:MAG: hypothetical protein EPO68_07230 [Planctomycetota bacterium]|nr:MAG: hypothetical protein EPO68_07230 [Planctomycetota bacterium]
MRARCWVGAALLSSLIGCGDAEGTSKSTSLAAPPQRAFAATTVLAIGEREVSAAEVDRVAKWIEQLYPQSADAHNRRRALTSVLLPRIALAEAHRAAHGEARERAQAARAQLAAGRAPAELTVREASGTWGPLGLEIFGPAHELALDAWSEPLEGLGRLLLVRVREKSGGPELGAVVLRVEIAEFPFVPEGSTQETIDRDIDTQTLVIVDPTWEQYVPLAWQHRLHGYLRNMK